MVGQVLLSNCYIRLLWMSCIDGVFRSAINAPVNGSNSYAAYLAAAKALGSSEPVVGYSLVPLYFPCTYYFSDDFQISNTGAVTGGVGATGVSSRAVSSTSRSGASSASSTSRSGASGTSSTSRSTGSASRASGSSSTSTSSSGALKPSSSSSPNYLVTNDLFTLLATA